MAVPKNNQGKSANIHGYDEANKNWPAVKINSATGGLLSSTLMEGRIIRVDDAGSGIVYYGFAAPGTITSAASWLIMKLDESSAPDWVLTYADGNISFDNVWDDRVSLSYS